MKAYEEKGLYRSRFEHDNCGIGAVVNIKGVKSHKVIEDALQIVENLEHRAGKDAEGETGDGVGILAQISHKFFEKVAKEEGIKIGLERDYGVGMFFLPQDELKRMQAKKIFEIVTEKEGLKFLGWREVPTNPDVLGQRAIDCMPHIEQAFIERPADIARGLDFDRRLFVIRKIFEQSNDTYVASLSSRTIVYKGMFLVNQLREFFLDLQDKDYESAIALVHSRFSTNTNPSWERAHPNRFIVHNGEINTIHGNADKMLAREETMESRYLKGEMIKVLPAIDKRGSDSAMLDNTLEFMVMNGLDLPLSVMLCIPEPWAHNKSMPRNQKDFYQYYATMMEPWDGPASILFSDGDCMGAVLDRNGLRPSRYYITDDDMLVLSSEVGVLDVDPAHIVLKERLHPGKMLLVNTAQGRVIDDQELKSIYADKHPYGEWLDGHIIKLNQLEIPNQEMIRYSKEECQQLQKAFGYTVEDLENAIIPMALNGTEGITAMGTDAPLAVLSNKKQCMSSYFKQLFAQVTNPPIDATREKVVTSTVVYLGKSGNLLNDTEDNFQVMRVENPILTDVDLLKIKHISQPGYKVEVVPTTYYINANLESMMNQLFVRVDKAISEGANIIILSDRGVDEYHMAIPSLLAVSGVQQHLVRTRKRTGVSLIIETGEPRNVHQFATLLGYGASAINPYLAYESIRHLIKEGKISKDLYAANDSYAKAILAGIVKIASKMGISTIQSYVGAKNFEAIGLKESFVEKYFTDTVSRIDGIGIEEIAEDYGAMHAQAFDPLEDNRDLELDNRGQHKRKKGGEVHLYTPQTIHALQQATREGDYELFKEYTKMVDEEGEGINLRGQFEFAYPKKGIPIEEVEPVSSIVQRFKTGAMSYGSISKEAHETLAVAMNKINGKSNSGEGGESIDRLGTEKGSAIKQVASGRFGVTSRYLVSAEEIQIKMAQGAKPGEGGHLPAGKVYPWIAKTRFSTPGVGLISPPPHHDIYSIEDLAQLIYDLKCANKNARVTVKLVSEAGVGTVAAGVAKAGAALILISGYDGGTGAAPESSIHNAGLPWELGLAEAHQTLKQNGLRERVRIETDGKLMSGRDVAIAAILGAEEYGFATAPLVTMGCVMARVCHKDTCPVGVATQNPELRKKFKGKPEYVINFMNFVAEELREYMAKLGVRTVDELVGRTDLLKIKEESKARYAGTLDLSKILYTRVEEPEIYNEEKQFDYKLEETLDETVLLKELESYIPKGKKKSLNVKVTNTDRAFGTLLGAEITRNHPDGLAEDTYKIKCQGAGGQSFGAFIPAGLSLQLEGDSNDYFGKGLSGGKLTVYPPKEALYKPEENIVIGNVALYGATSGKAFINGIAGERFCVRNSGAVAVVEGVGDHGCEYMTGGRVVILGEVGKNFAAGMSGGIAYVYDPKSTLYRKINRNMVDMSYISSKYDVMELRNLIQDHLDATGSPRAKRILENFEEHLPKFKKVIPFDYEKMLAMVLQFEEKGLTSEQAKIEAFYALNGTN